MTEKEFQDWTHTLPEEDQGLIILFLGRVVFDENVMEGLRVGSLRLWVKEQYENKTASWRQFETELAE